MRILRITGKRGGSDLKKCIAFIMIMILMIIELPVSVCAATIQNVSTSIDTDKKVTVAGTISSGVGHQITIMIIDPNGKTEYLDSTISTSEGDFKFTYTMTNNVTGKYEVSIGADSATTIMKTDFFYGTNADLKNLEISIGTLEQKFSPDTIEYSSSVDSRVKSIAIAATASDSKSGIKINGITTLNGIPSQLNKLNYGSNIIPIEVTALNGTVKSYHLNVTRLEKTAPTITVDAVVDDNKQVTVSGETSSGDGQPISVKILDPNNKVEYLDITNSSSGGKFKFTYIITNQIKGKYNVSIGTSGLDNSVTTYFNYGNEAKLSNLIVDNVIFDEVFQTDIDTYSAVAGKNVKYITLKPTAKDAKAVIEINHDKVKSGDSSKKIGLNQGDNTIQIKVTAQDGITTCTYILHVNKEYSKAAISKLDAKVNKQKLVSINGVLSSGFGEQVSVMVRDPNGNVNYLNSSISSDEGDFGFTYSLSGKVKGKYSVMVGAKGMEVTANTYFIYDPGNADLKNLLINQTDINPQFSPSNTNYTAHVSYNTTTVTVNPTTEDPEAVIKVNQAVVGNEMESQAIPLYIGINTIYVEVTSQDGTNTKTYTVNLERADIPPTPQSPISVNTGLTNLELSTGELYKDNDYVASGFSTDVTEYYVRVESNSINVIPTTSGPAAITVNDQTVTSGTASVDIPLPGMDNIIIVVVTIEKTTVTYIVHVQREEVPPVVSGAAIQFNPVY